MLGFKGNRDYALSRLKSYRTGSEGVKTGVVGGAVANRRFAQGQVIFTQPQFYSPLHTPQNWQIPSKRREVYQWQIVKPCSIVSEDYTFKTIDDIHFIPSEKTIDTVTGGFFYDMKDAELILSSTGKFRSPCKISSRELEDKEAIELKAQGYWRSLFVTEDHIQIVLDGKKYRQRVKSQKDNETRRQKGIPSGTPRLDKDEPLIKRLVAGEVNPKDYLLFPISSVGKENISSNLAWIVGNCLADGCIFNYRTTKGTHFTLNEDDAHISDIAEILEDNFGSSRTRKHGSGKGLRVICTRKKACEFFSDYITGKRTEKKLMIRFFDLDKESRLHALGGYFDGDGSFSKNEKLVANCYSMDMADQIYAALLSVGINCSLNRVPLYGDHYPTDSKWVYRIIIPSSYVNILKPYMRSGKIPVDYEPKNRRDLRFFYEEDGVKYLAQPVDYVKKFLYTGEGFDMQVDPERAFVACGYVSSNCRYFTENEPKVGAAISFYSTFPMNGFETICANSRVKRFFDAFNKKIDFDKWNPMISHEVFMLGDAFPFAEIGCDKCQGTSMVKGRECHHEGAVFRRLVVLNPDWIDVQQNAFSDEPVITLLPDEELKRVVWYKQPAQIYNRIPKHIQALVLANQAIPLSNESATHLAYHPSPYGGGYGTSLVRRLFKVLTYKDKLMTAQWIVAERLILPVRIIKVGNDERPAGPADIADVQAQIAQVSQDPNLTLVTHHAFDYDWVGASGKILQLTNEYELLNKEILQGLMLNDALLSGEMGGYQSAAIGAEALIQRIESWRNELSRWIEESIYKPIAKWQGFVDEEATKEYGEELGEEIYIYPKIQWNDLNIRDTSNDKQIFMQLHDKQIMSSQTLCEKMDLDYDQEVERLRFESAQMQFGQEAQMAAGGAGGGMPMGGAPPMGGEMGPPPGGELGAPPGGEMGMPGGEMGAPPPPPGAAAVGSAGKIMTKSHATKNLRPAEEQQAQPSGTRLTSLEQIMYKTLSTMDVPFQRFAQYPLGQYRVDFAIPTIRLAIECDGEQWHAAPEAKAHDKSRDMALANAGWTVMRFGETELKENLAQVRQALATQVHKSWKSALAAQKAKSEKMEQASSSMEALVKQAKNEIGEDGELEVPGEDELTEQ